MKKFNLTYRALGEEALLIEWPSRIDEAILEDILMFQKFITEKLNTKIQETINTYHTLSLFFDPDIISFDELVTAVKEIHASEKNNTKHLYASLWEIPVCYDVQFGIDLGHISKEKDLTWKEIIALHSKPIYTVYFMGFLPGFLYLGGLSEKLFIPRKETPRPVVVRGAVAIGGSQTGIYPCQSPGGWNIIGNSPVQLFNAQINPPSGIRAGDKIRFVPISLSEHEALSRDISRGLVRLKPHSK